MTSHRDDGFDLARLSSLILDRIPVAITVIDPDGHILYFNEYSTQILDRKPEYIGRDVRQCHDRQESRDKIDRILEGFKAGSRQPAHYEASREGRHFSVSVLPLLADGRLLGGVHSVILKL
jgi:PAS domain S-box-containing protein